MLGRKGVRLSPPDGLVEYRLEKNLTSIDAFPTGLPVD